MTKYVLGNELMLFKELIFYYQNNIFTINKITKLQLNNIKVKTCLMCYI